MVRNLETVGRLPFAFDHPSQGAVDALIMYRQLHADEFVDPQAFGGDEATKAIALVRGITTKGDRDPVTSVDLRMAERGLIGHFVGLHTQRSDGQ